jgi:hypothetical protein
MEGLRRTAVWYILRFIESSSEYEFQIDARECTAHVSRTALSVDCGKLKMP